MPGIESATIKTLDRGSIKRASVVIKVHNRLQFDIIDMLYLRLGYTIMLEWGDSHYLDNNNKSNPVSKMGNTLIENFWFRQQTGTNNTFEILQKIEDERKKYSASYDALFGRVVNFSWTFNPDASYTVNLDILSMGDVIESLKTNIPVHSFYTQDGEKDKEDENIIIANKYKSTIGYLFNQFQYPFEVPPTEESLNLPIPTSDTRRKENGFTLQDYISTTFVAQEITVKSIDNKDIYPDNIIGQALSYEFVKSFKLFPIYDEQNTNNEPGTIKWNKAVIPITPRSSFPKGMAGREEFNQALDKRNSDAMKPPIDYIRMAFMPPEFSYYVRFGAFLTVLEETVLTYHNNDPNQPSVKFDNKVIDNLMYFVPNMVSIDPKVCLISNDQFKQTSKEGNLFANTANVMPEIEPFIYRNGDNSYGMIMNIYLNFGFILQQLNKVDKDDNVYLQDFLKNICNGINSSLGRVNNLFPKIDPKTNIYSIYDETALPGKSKLPDNIFPKSSLPKEIGRFNLYGYSIGGKGKTPKNSSNFVHKVGITTSVTPEYATMITIGATANGEVVGENATAFSKWNVGIKDRFNTNITTSKRVAGQNSLTPQQRKQNKYKAINRNYFSATAARVDGDNLIYLGLSKLGPNMVNRTLFYSDFGGRLGQDEVGSPERRFTSTTARNYKIDSEVVSSNKQIFSAYYKQLQNRAAINTSKSSGDIGFLPFKLQLDMDGISGLRIYNKIDVDPGFLPSNYSRRKFSDPNTLEFLVTDITHTIRNNQWITSIDSIASVGNLFTTKELEEAVDFEDLGALKRLIEDKQLKNAERAYFNTELSNIPSTSPSRSNPNPKPASKPTPKDERYLPYIPDGYDTAYNMKFTNTAWSGFKDTQKPLLFIDAVRYLTKNHPDIGRSVFAIMYAESSKANLSFKTPGGYNYSGTQTDELVWSGSNKNGTPPSFITGQFGRIDNKQKYGGGKKRTFAMFNSQTSFMDWMASRAKSRNFPKEKNFSQEAWAERYLNGWVGLNMVKQQPTRYKGLFPGKKDIAKDANRWYTEYIGA